MSKGGQKIMKTNLEGMTLKSEVGRKWILEVRVVKYTLQGRRIYFVTYEFGAIKRHDDCFVSRDQRCLWKTWKSFLEISILPFGACHRVNHQGEELKSGKATGSLVLQIVKSAGVGLVTVKFHFDAHVFLLKFVHAKTFGGVLMERNFSKQWECYLQA